MHRVRVHARPRTSAVSARISVGQQYVRRHCSKDGYKLFANSIILYPNVTALNISRGVFSRFAPIIRLPSTAPLCQPPRRPPHAHPLPPVKQIVRGPPCTNNLRVLPPSLAPLWHRTQSHDSPGCRPCAAGAGLTKADRLVTDNNPSTHARPWYRRGIVTRHPATG